jgi:hypothetical protein
MKMEDTAESRPEKETTTLGTLEEVKQRIKTLEGQAGFLA